MTITLVTPGHLSSNPRLVKEAQLFAKAGYQVRIFCTWYLSWQAAHDQQLINRHSDWQVTVTDWTGGSFFSRLNRLWSAVQNRWNRLISRWDHSPRRAALLLNRHVWRQSRQMTRVPTDLIIAHNLGALPAAIRAGRSHKVPVCFDAEDFHRGEPVASGPDGWALHLVENTFIPACHATWSASPSIGAAYQTLFPSLAFTPVLNVFPEAAITNNRIQDPSAESPLKLFWFSQTIGRDRGLEDVLRAMSAPGCETLHLTLVGFLSREDEVYFRNLAGSAENISGRITFLKPVEEKELFSLAAQHHVGLALERPAPLNRDLCLTNKIFTYLCGGMAIAYSATTAQTAFYHDHPKTGFLYEPGDSKALAGWLSSLLQHPDRLSAHRQASLELAIHRYHWEKEGIRVLSIIESVMGKPLPS
ncbi:MAG: hypothetical protein HUU10_09355 [Bacteroidetes bacterium]|nr:hypothetical protein [Bacteroidota bacterium]